jgi:hypothetical protein
MSDKNTNDIDAKRRLFLKRILGAGFAGPSIATFSISALMANDGEDVCAAQYDQALFLSFFEQYADPTCSTTSTGPTTTPAGTTTGMATTTGAATTTATATTTAGVTTTAGATTTAAVTTTVPAPSDVRFKVNVEPFSPVLAKISRLQPVHYDWRVDEYPEFQFPSTRTSGLIAQEVENIFPGMVSEDSRGFKRVNYGELPIMMLQAIRELKAENDNLREQLKRNDETMRELQAAVSSVQNLVGMPMQGPSAAAVPSTEPILV